MTIGELTYSLGAEWDQGSLKNIQDGFASVSKSFLGAIALASGAMAGTFAVVQQFAGINDELGKLARNTNISVGSLQAMQYSFEGAGLSASKAGDVLKKLQEQKEGFLTGKADYEAFARIGINPQQFSNTEDYFNAVLDGLGNIKDEATKADLAKRLLGSDDMQNLIDGGSEAIRKQKKELAEMGVLMSNQDFKASEEFNNLLLKTVTILKGLANKVMTSIMPIFSKLMKQFNSFLKANKELISSGLRKFLDAIITGSQFFLSLIGRVVEHLGGLKNTIIIIAGLLLIWQLPLIATIAIVIGLLLIFDDVMNFFKGNDSVIGDWIKSIKESFQEFKESFPNLAQIFEAQFAQAIATFKFFKDSFFNLWDLITGKIDLKTAFDAQLVIIKSFATSLYDQLLSVFDAIANMAKNLFANLIPDMPTLDGVLSFMGLGANNNAQAVASPVSQTTSSSTQNTYHINASVDATNKTVGEAITEISAPNGY